MSKQKFEIICEDNYGDNCLSDKVSDSKTPNERKPQGKVHVYEITDDGEKKLLHKSNLVVYLGREMLAQRLVNVNNDLVRPTKDEFISWFGLGTGGVRAADLLDPVSPVITDVDLNEPCMINDSTGNVYAHYNIAGSTDSNTEVTFEESGYYKKAFDSVEFESDIQNDNYYLVIKITTTIGSADANAKQLSEAGLFSAESNAGGFSGNFSLFARVTFPTIIKTSERRLIFVWYLYV